MGFANMNHHPSFSARIGIQKVVDVPFLAIGYRFSFNNFPH